MRARIVAISSAPAQLTDQDTRHGLCSVVPAGRILSCLGQSGGVYLEISTTVIITNGRTIVLIFRVVRWRDPFKISYERE